MCAVRKLRHGEVKSATQHCVASKWRGRIGDCRACSFITHLSETVCDLNHAVISLVDLRKSRLVGEICIFT